MTPWPSKGGTRLPMVAPASRRSAALSDVEPVTRERLPGLQGKQQRCAAHDLYPEGNPVMALHTWFSWLI
ncbi:hypothetical protein BH23CHL2_BH23CHL2_27480 [soil metagenome]